MNRNRRIFFIKKAYGFLQVFGEIHLITRFTPRFSVRAITHCDLLTIGHLELGELLRLFPELVDELIRRVEDRFASEMPRLVMHRSLTHTLGDDQRWHFGRDPNVPEDAEDVLQKAHRLLPKTGEKLRPMLPALKIDRPWATLFFTPSMDFFKIEDPILELLAPAYDKSAWVRFRYWLADAARRVNVSCFAKEIVHATAKLFCDVNRRSRSIHSDSFIAFGAWLCFC